MNALPEPGAEALIEATDEDFVEQTERNEDLGAPAHRDVRTGRSPGRVAWDRLKKDKVAIFCSVIIIFFILVAIFAPFLGSLQAVDPVTGAEADPYTVHTELSTSNGLPTVGASSAHGRRGSRASAATSSPAGPSGRDRRSSSASSRPASPRSSASRWPHRRLRGRPGRPHHHVGHRLLPQPADPAACHRHRADRAEEHRRRRRPHRRGDLGDPLLGPHRHPLHLRGGWALPDWCAARSRVCASASSSRPPVPSGRPPGRSSSRRSCPTSWARSSCPRRSPCRPTSPTRRRSATSAWASSSPPPPGAAPSRTPRTCSPPTPVVVALGHRSLAARARPQSAGRLDPRRLRPRAVPLTSPGSGQQMFPAKRWDTHNKGSKQQCAGPKS